MAVYVDVTVVPVEAARLAEYRSHAKKWAKIWKKLGALDYVEFAGDDVKPGKTTSFPQALKLKDGEIAVVSLITYKSRKHRDGMWKKVMAHPEMKDMDMSKVPFDGKRIFWGGFKQIV